MTKKAQQEIVSIVYLLCFQMVFGKERTTINLF